MSKPKQSFENHARWFPMYHFIASPITAIAALHLTWHFIRNPSTPHFLEALYGIAIATAVLSSRLMAITVQNRVIRLEMRLRLKEILPAALVPRIHELTVRQLVALRFASDAEMPALVERTLKGEFATQKDIKRAITDWQADHLRA